MRDLTSEELKQVYGGQVDHGEPTDHGTDHGTTDHGEPTDHGGVDHGGGDHVGDDHVA